MADAPCCMNKELGHADCGCRAGATPDLIPRADAELAVAEVRADRDETLALVEKLQEEHKKG